jgi:hypothetical protein
LRHYYAAAKRAANLVCCPVERYLSSPELEACRETDRDAAGTKATDAHPPAFATFEDGYRANVIVEAILESAAQGSVWTKVNY